MINKIKRIMVKKDELLVFFVLFSACLKLPYALQDIGNIFFIAAICLSVIYLIVKGIHFLKRREKLHCKYNIFFFIIIFLFFVSIIINFNDQWIRNILVLCSGIIYFFILFNFFANRKVVFEDIHKINMVIIYPTFIYGVIMCVFLALRGTVIFTNLSGGVFEIGWGLGRIIGIYGNSNSASFACLSSLAISLIEVVIGEKIKKYNKIIVRLNIVIQFVGLLISSSRSAFLASVVGVFVLCVVKLKNKGLYPVKKIIGAIGLTALYCVGFFFLSIVIFLIPGYRLPVTTYVDLQKGTTRFEEIDPDELDSQFVSMAYRILTGAQTKDSDGKEEIDSWDGLDQYSSGRLVIWKSALQVFKRHYIGGTGVYGLEDYLVTESDMFKGYSEEQTNKVFRNYFSVHNDFLQALVSGGIFGGCLFIGIIISIYFYIIRVLRSSNNIFEKKLLGTLMAHVSGILVMAMFLYILYFGAFSTGAIFWTYFGMAFYYAKQIDSKKIVKQEKHDERQKCGIGYSK